MDDQEAILGLLQSYADEFDSRNAVAFSALFADGAVLVDPGGREIAGRVKFVKMVERTPKGGPPYMSQHFANGTPAINANYPDMTGLVTSGHSKGVKMGW